MSVMTQNPISPPAGERFLKFAEVRQMLGVSKVTLWRWTAERGLKVVRIGEVARIRESELQAFLRRHERGNGEVAAGSTKEQEQAAALQNSS